jgi:hypothetical protein
MLAGVAGVSPCRPHRRTKSESGMPPRKLTPVQVRDRLLTRVVKFRGHEVSGQVSGTDSPTPIGNALQCEEMVGMLPGPVDW